MKICSIEGCKRKAIAKKLCSAHYMARRRKKHPISKQEKEQRRKRYKIYYPKHREQLIRQRREKRRLERLSTLSHYSNGIMACACCGEKHIEFLTIDHINGDGAKHRKELRLNSSDSLYKWLIKNNFPEGFQVLCYNCNCAKGAYGACPHQRQNL